MLGELPQEEGPVTRKDRPKNIALVAAIARLGFSNQKTARLAGIDRSTLSKLVCQRQDAAPTTQRKLARVLGVTPADLFPVEAGER